MKKYLLSLGVAIFIVGILLSGNLYCVISFAGSGAFCFSYFIPFGIIAMIFSVSPSIFSFLPRKKSKPENQQREVSTQPRRLQQNHVS
jgi:hypothetical protein